MARVLGRVRLSRYTEESTSTDRQKEIITDYARMHGHEVVAWAVDIDVSRGVDPFSAPELSPYFKTEKSAEWDIVACWKLDRLAVGSIYLNKIMSWCFEHEKNLVSVTENLDLSSWVGRLIANVIAGVAEGEWEAIKERNTAGRAALVKAGRWYGGTPSFGYRASKPDGPKSKGWILEPDPDEVPLVVEMFERVARQGDEGRSPRAVAQWLNEEHPSARPRRGGLWDEQGVRRILRSRTVLGQQVHKGKVVTEPDGLPMQRAEPIVSLDLWNRVQDRLADRSKPRHRRIGVQLLLNVARCGACGSNLYYVESGKDVGYWRCRSYLQRTGCEARSIPAAELEQFVEEQFLEDIGHLERTERVYHPAEGNAAERERLGAAIESIRREKDMGLYDDDESGYFDRVQTLVDRRRQLGEEDRPARYEHQSTGQTYREAWDQMSTEERRGLLLGAGIEVIAQARPFRAEFRVPEDVQARLQQS